MSLKKSEKKAGDQIQFRLPRECEVDFAALRRVGYTDTQIVVECMKMGMREVKLELLAKRALKAGTNAPPSIAATPAQANSEPPAPSFYAPPFRIVKDSNAPPRINSEAPALPATNTTRTATNAEPVDWRTPEQRAKWEAIEKQFSKWPDPSQVQTKTQRQSETTKAPKTSGKRK